MRKFGIIAVLSLLVTAFAAVPALAQVAPDTYTPTSDSFNSANAPGSSNLKSGTPQCVVEAGTLDVDCSAYVLSGVGNTNATTDLSATYSAIIDCRNHGGNVVESHETTFSSTGGQTLFPGRNGQLRVLAVSASAGDVEQVCPNPNWTPEIQPGTLVLETFTYTLQFAGFSEPYITITASDP
jgi:hypothetical protein